ncbi:membrane protein [Streptomyces sp. NRRL S-104]|nr:membrane protein [Streptomyces sp. NRRL S-104]
MSEKNDGANRDATKRSARERLQAERERQKTRDKRRRTMIVAAAVVGVLGLATVVGVIAANAGKGDKSDSAGPVVAPSGATGKDALAIQTGKPEAKSTLTVWEDFRCPACKSFEDNYRDTVHELEAKGLLKVDYHLVTLIDGNMGGSGSLKGANAAACAQDAGKFAEYHDVLFQNQPQEVDDAYGKNAKLLELAGKVEGLDTPEFRKCVEDGTHNSWVAKSHEAFAAGNFRGTPTVLLDGKDIFSDQANPLTPQKLKEKVEAGAKGSGGAGAKGTEKETGKETGKDAGKDTGKGEAKASPSASRTASTASKGTPNGSGTGSRNATGNGSSGD